jgi:acyl-coenzyme A thioesterase 9
MNGKVFGGFLMRKAIELAFVCVEQVYGNKFELLSVDTIHFLKPVNIGTILKLQSVIIYSDDKSGNVRVKVKASVVTSL